MSPSIRDLILSFGVVDSDPAWDPSVHASRWSNEPLVILDSLAEMQRSCSRSSALRSRKPSSSFSASAGRTTRPARDRHGVPRPSSLGDRRDTTPPFRPYP